MKSNSTWQPQPDSARRVLPILTLVGWQFRQTWRLLIVSAIGMVAAVVLVCAVPLYSRVALSTGLRGLLGANDSNSTVLIYGSQVRPGISDSINQIDQTIQQDLGDKAAPLSPLILHVQGQLSGAPIPGLFIMLPDTHPQHYNDLPSANTNNPQIQLVGYPQQQLTPQVKLLQGRLPQPTADGAVEIALLPSAASCLYVDPAANKCTQVKVGDELTVVSPFFINEPASASAVAGTSPSQNSMRIVPWKLRVVGLFQPRKGTDTFWHQRTFTNTQINTSDHYTNLSTALVTNEEMTPLLDRLPQVGNGTSAGPAPSNRPAAGFLAETTQIFWYYPFNISHIEADDISSLIDSVQNFEGDAKLNNASVRIEDVVDPLDVLQQYRTRLALAELPVNLLLIVVTGMVLLFISVTTELLVERQTDVIAVLRSRGASRHQIFGIFTAQSLILALLVLLIGPLLAIPVAAFLVQRIFSASDMGALSLITSAPFAAAWNVHWYALIALAATLLVSLLTLLRATSLDVLALRRETGRAGRPSFWQRFYLDGLLAFLALAGYGYTLYAINTGVLSSQDSIEILSPMVLLASVLFLLAAILLFLRYFPRFAQWAAHLAARNSGAAPMLALAQLARSPRQAQRIILLLTLTTALTIFALVFSASQSQRVIDVVNYQVGADFSAWLSNDLNTNTSQSASETALSGLTTHYRAIPGVGAAALGSLNMVHIQGNSLMVKAVDTRNYASTAIWSPQYSTDALPALMVQLIARRHLAQTQHIVPAIVDAETWQALNLTPGAHFSVEWDATTRIPCLAVAEVQHIPTTSTISSNFTSRSILVDYQSLVPTYTAITQEPLPLNYVWLHMRPGANPLDVRAALKKRMQNGTIIFDRQAFIAAMQQDPVTLNMVGALAIGTVTPLLLALVGSLLVSWLSTRNRLVNFSVLRALGTSPRQIAGVISWEQCFIYLLMLVLGVLAGIMLSAMVLPSLILTSVVITDSSGNITSNPALQGGLPALQMVFPPSLLIVLGILIVICALALSMMARMAARPSLGQVLRLNTD